MREGWGGMGLGGIVRVVDILDGVVYLIFG